VQKICPLCSLKRTSCSFDQLLRGLVRSCFLHQFFCRCFHLSKFSQTLGAEVGSETGGDKTRALKSHAATSLTISATGLRRDFFRCLGRCFSTYIFYAKMCECEPPFAGLGPVGLGQIIYPPHGFYALFSAAPKICTKFETRVDYQKTYGTQSWIACLALVLWCGINW